MIENQKSVGFPLNDSKTTSNGTIEDDRPVGGGLEAADKSKGPPYRLLFSKVNKSQSPLFAGYKEDIQVVLPYISEEDLRNKTLISSDNLLVKARIYLSEVLVLHKPQKEVVPLANPNVRLLIAGYAERKSLVKNPFKNVPMLRSAFMEEEHVIHDFRQVIQKGLATNKIDVDMKSDLYLLITRKKSDDLSKTDNVYTIGLRHYKKYPPELYSGVFVRYRKDESLFNIPVKDTNTGDTIATFVVAESVTPINSET